MSTCDEAGNDHLLISYFVYLKNMKLFEIINKEYDKPLDNLPSRLKILRFHANKFIHSLNNLPDSVEIIDFGQWFDQPYNKIKFNISTICRSLL